MGNKNKRIEEQFDSSLTTNATDAQMVSRMRMVLAVSVLLAVFVDPSGLSAAGGGTWLVFFGYLFHSIVIYIYSQLDKPLLQSVLIHRLDVLWFALIVVFTGGVASFFFLFFFFAILVSSFRWGFEEGARITVASAFVFAISGLLMGDQNDIPRLLLRTTFLLVIGYLCCHWGESKVRLMHQLALLRDVSKLSNPRFGVDHTITQVLEKTRFFFKAKICILVMYNKESGVYSIRTIKESGAPQAITADLVNAEAGLPLLGLLHNHINVYVRALWPVLSPLVQESMICECTKLYWHEEKKASSKNLAEIFDARSFISAPLSLLRQQGRIYIISSKKVFNKADALFLYHIAEQVFPVIENIELLDKMASKAASQERYKISLDLHDTAIQPYIGLKLGLGALRNKATDNNPLIEDIDKLTMMAEKVIGDLRRYAVTFKISERQSESILFVMLSQQAANFKEFYGVNISIVIPRELVLSDRLATEVIQLVCEGLTNVCKHTLSKKGFVQIQFANNIINIQIKNEYTGSPPVNFKPRSISERVDRLGGKVCVNLESIGNTVVNVEIPV